MLHNGSYYEDFITKQRMFTVYEEWKVSVSLCFLSKLVSNKTKSTIIHIGILNLKGNYERIFTCKCPNKIFNCVFFLMIWTFFFPSFLSKLYLNGNGALTTTWESLKGKMIVTSFWNSQKRQLFYIAVSFPSGFFRILSELTVSFLAIFWDPSCFFILSTSYTNFQYITLLFLFKTLTMWFSTGFLSISGHPFGAYVEFSEKLYFYPLGKKC